MLQLIVPREPAEAFFCLAGAVLGLFFALDAWRRIAKDTDLSKTSRVKDFIWVIGGATIIFLTDWNRLAPKATIDISRALSIYLAWFVIAMVASVGFIAVGIFAAARPVRRHSPSFPRRAVLDYLFFGYVQHQKSFSDRLEAIENETRAKRAAFLNLLAKCFGEATAAVGVGMAGTPDQRRHIRRSILQSMQRAVLAYYADSENLKVNCNLMVAKDMPSQAATPNPIKLFLEQEGIAYRGCLHLQEYADDTGREEFALPIAIDRANVLSGAPAAFQSNRPTVISDVSKIAYPKSMDKALVAEAKAYFQSKGFKSFMCLNVFASGKQLGIVNVETNRTYGFGKSEEEHDVVGGFLLPFCSLLGYLVD